jgi:cofilin
MVLVIGGEEITVESTAPPSATFEDMLEQLPFTDCRYVVFDQEYTTYDGRKANKLFFIAWLPHNATPYNKMAYTHAKRMMRESLDGVFDVTVSTRDELEVAMGYKQDQGEDSDSDIEGL